MTKIFNFITHASYLCGLLLLAACSCSPAWAQQPTPPQPNPSFSARALMNSSAGLAPNGPPPLMRPAPSLIIRNFIDAETRFREVLKQFCFKRDVVLQTIGDQGEVTGEYIRNSVFVLDDAGERFEQVFYHPKSSITAMKITKEDIQDLASSQFLGLEAADLNRYDLTYAGETNVGGQPAYLIQVRPRDEPDPNSMRARFFVGQIWLDQSTFQIVKLSGTTEPHGKQRFPTFQTARDQQVEKLRFPSATSADEVLHFPHADVHYRITVRYYDFKRFAARLKIFEGER